ncbi:MAG: hypothetical protein O2955_00430 [Planctomycetota bacterium]|nr:hypothetical protein [Planctomycetota bacterium]MDA1210947.1 hypothetical protein [Planctomycetota bacterium]
MNRQSKDPLKVRAIGLIRFVISAVTLHTLRASVPFVLPFMLLQMASLQAAGLQIAYFTADISPPLHQRVCVGFIQEFTEIEHPLLAKGVILKDDGGVYVLCALDYCGLCNDSYDAFRRQIAAAAKTPPKNVAVQSLHQHTSPVFDANTDRLLYGDDQKLFDEGRSAEKAAIDSIVDAIEHAQSNWSDVSHLTAVTQKVDRVASNRRVEQPDGSIVVRYSAGAKDPAMRAAPEGLIDPMLRTITFFNDKTPLLRMHYYATHPQTRSGGKVTYDAVGMARERVEQMTGVPQMYFTGCGGNVTMGKYNSGTDAERAEISDRLFQAMTAACKKADRAEQLSSETIDWSTAEVNFPIREDAPFSEEFQRNNYQDTNVAFSSRLRSAMYVSWIDRLKKRPGVEFSCLTIGNVRMVHLPGEPFVQFQLAAQNSAGDDFVAVAGYGECAPWYIGEDRIFTDNGGYEQTWSFVAPCEGLMHETIRNLMTSPK